MTRLLFALVLSFLPMVAQAQCRGTDLRTQMPQSQLEAFSAQAARVPFSKGMHWVARKGDQSIHLIGTFHSGDRRHNRNMRTLAPYVRAADLVVLEVHSRASTKFFDEIEKRPDLFLLRSPPFVDQLMAPELWQQLSQRSTIAGAGEEVLKRLQPFILESTLLTSECDPYAWQRHKRGLDEKVERLAQRRGIPVLAFETPEQSMRGITDIPLRDQVRMLELLMLTQTGNADISTTLRNSYFEEQVVLGILIHNQYAFRDVKVSRREVARLNKIYSRYLLDRRNKRWMPILLNRKEKTIVVAVGAAHLSGKNGLANLLKAQGYTLQNIPVAR